MLVEFTPAKFAAMIADPKIVLWLAEAAEGPGGFIDSRLDARNEHLPDLRQAEVARLHILDRFARRGIGSALLHLGHAAAAQAGATALWLTMYSGNNRARAFYEALGWRKVGNWAFTLANKSYPNDVLAITVAPAAL